jgi:23S rRNA pseudouridine2605 synthase
MSNPSQKLSKWIAHTGHCSRRDAEKLILEGRVSIEGQVVTDVGRRVEGDPFVTIDGLPLGLPMKPRLWAFYKPREVMCTAKDPQGRTTVFDLLPKTMPRVVSVGRLDYMTEGLLLLTNNGEVSRYLERPTQAIPRVYEVRVYGAVPPDFISQLQKGMTIDGVAYRPVGVRVLKKGGANTVLELTLTEGKNREIRRICQAFDLAVNRLRRVSFGPVTVDEMQPGEVKEVPLWWV